MKPFNSEQFETLVNEQKWDEAKTLISDLLQEDLTPEQKGAVYVNLAMTYMELNYDLQQTYKQLLDETIGALKITDETEKHLNDSIDMGLTRSEIQDIYKKQPKKP